MLKNIFFLFLVMTFTCVTAIAQVTPPANTQGLQEKMQMLGQLLSQNKTQQSAPAPNAQQLQQIQQLQKQTAKQNQSQNKPNIEQTQPKQTQTPQQQLLPTNQNASPSSDLYENAFTGVVNQMLPMSPKQIKRLRGLFNDTQRAAATPAGTPPKPITTSVLVNLAPDASPPVIRLGAGYISSLVFLDSTGQPWPIEAYSIGNPNAFNIQWDKKGNTLLIQSISYYKRSNLAVILKGLNTPVMITLLSDQTAVDYRVDLRIPGLGPNAVLIQNGLPDAANPILLDVLNGIPPRGSKTLNVIGGNCQAWLLKDKLYLRTRLTVISPAWKAVMSSVDGTHAYELQPTPVVLALQNGKDKTLNLTLEGFE